MREKNRARAKEVAAVNRVAAAKAATAGRISQVLQNLFLRAWRGAGGVSGRLDGGKGH